MVFSFFNIIDPNYCDAAQAKLQSFISGAREVHSSGPTYSLLESDLRPLGLHLTQEDGAL